MALKGYEKAGRLIRFFAWFGFALAGVVGVAIAIPMMASGKGGLGLLAGLCMFLFVGGMCWLQLILGQAVKDHKEWARTVGIILGVIQMIGFPIGTLIGGYIVYHLWKGWDDPAPAQ